MAYSAGTFSLVSGNPVVTGRVISSVWANDTLTDIAANGLTIALLKDGTQTVTANIPFAGFRLTGIGAPTTAGDALREGSAIGAASAAAGSFTTGSFTGAVTLTAAAPQLTLGVNTTTLGSVKFFGSTSGDATIQPAAVAGTSTVITLPATSVTLNAAGSLTGTTLAANVVTSSLTSAAGGSFGTAAFTAATAYATSGQGATADTAVQPATLTAAQSLAYAYSFMGI